MATGTTIAGNSSPSWNQPIGYWLKLINHLLDEGTNAIHSERGINRTQWQLLHLLSLHKALNIGQLMETMLPFTGKTGLLTILEELQANSTLEQDEGYFKLSKKGLELHDDCYKQQQAFREKTMKGITGQDYDTTVNTLQKMAANLS